MATAVCIVLGLFEFISATGIIFHPELKGQKEPLIPPVILEQTMTRVLLAVYVMTLGLQRLTWATSRSTTYSWLCLLLTHIIEGGMWWFFAFSQPHLFNTTASDVKFDVILKETVTLRSKGGVPALIVLCGVPILVLFFALSGPNNQSKKAKSH